MEIRYMVRAILRNNYTIAAAIVTESELAAKVADYLDPTKRDGVVQVKIQIFDEKKRDGTHY